MATPPIGYIQKQMSLSFSMSTSFLLWEFFSNHYTCRYWCYDFSTGTPFCYHQLLIWFSLFWLQVITFIDLAGHEKYLKTTVFGMTGHVPDFCMLMVSAAWISCRTYLWTRCGYIRTCISACNNNMYNVHVLTGTVKEIN